MPTITTDVRTNGTGDYLNPISWEADLDNAGVYSAGDDAVGQCFDDAAFTPAGTMTCNGGNTIGLASVTLNVAAGEGNDGTEGTGPRIEAASNFLVISMANPAAVPYTLDGFEIDASDGGCLSNTSAGAGSANVFKRLILHNVGAVIGFIDSRSRDSLTMSCIMYDNVRTGATTGAEFDADLATGGVLYNALYGVEALVSGDALGFKIGSDDADGRIRGNISGGIVSTATATDFTFSGGTANLTATNNMSEDATADDPGQGGDLINQTMADVFVSIVGGSENLKLKAGSPAIGAGVDLGTTPTGVQDDILGRDRDAELDTWDMGAHQFVAAAPVGGDVAETNRLVAAVNREVSRCTVVPVSLP